MHYSKEKLEQLKNRWITPRGKNFLKIIKESRCYLNKILFREKIHNLPLINDREITSGIDLRGAPLAGFDFRISVQDGDDGFYEEFAIISNIHFEGANLKHCNFTEGKIHNCHFEYANLAHADFKNTTLNNCSFTEADLTGLNLNGSKLINCDFNGSNIKDLTLSSTIVDGNTDFGQKLKSEENKNFLFASIEYKQIQEMYKNSGLHNLADQYYYKCMVAKRKINKISSPKRWLNYIFGDLLCKYGTSFGRVFLSSAFIVVLCALLLNLNKSLLYNNELVEASFPDALYFSLVTFTTLGYGDFHAVGLMRFISGLEAFVGAVLMSLFTVIIARKIIRE